MGQELECTMRHNHRTVAGKALLETDYIIFRGGERLKIPLKDVVKVSASDGVLNLEFTGGSAQFELGNAAPKWADKILHPPSRLSKLGIQPETSVRLEGEFDADFVEELRREGAHISKTRSDVVLFLAARTGELKRVARLASAFQTDGALWVVYPKGVTAIREIHFIEAGRAAGLKDVKVASFSPTQTALKFVVPVPKR